MNTIELDTPLTRGFIAAWTREYIENGGVDRPNVVNGRVRWEVLGVTLEGVAPRCAVEALRSRDVYERAALSGSDTDRRVAKVAYDGAIESLRCYTLYSSTVRPYDYMAKQIEAVAASMSQARYST